MTSPESLQEAQDLPHVLRFNIEEVCTSELHYNRFIYFSAGIILELCPVNLTSDTLCTDVICFCRDEPFLLSHIPDHTL